MNILKTIGRFLGNHPVAISVSVLLGGIAWCSTGSDDGVLTEPLPSPNGGEVWATGVVDSVSVAVGPGGTYASVDYGDAWRRVGPAPHPGTATRPDPLSIHVLGQALFLNLEGRVYRTTDAGRAWEVVFERESQVFQFAGRLHALTSGLLLRSTDDGRTWSDTVLRALPGPSGALFGATAEVLTTGDVAYISNGRTGLRSVDRGQTWDSVPGILPPLPANPLRGPPVGPDVKADYAVLRDTIYALLSEGLIRRSVDHGSTWVDMPGRITRPRAGASRLLAAGGGLWVSGDGVTCRVMTSTGGCSVLPRLPAIHGIFADHVLLAATAEGPWRSRDQGASWTEAHAGIPAAVNGLAVAARTYFVAANRRLFRSNDSAMAWTSSREFSAPPQTVLVDRNRVFAFAADTLVSCDLSLQACVTRPVRLPAGSGDTVEVIPGTVHQLNGVLRVGAHLRPSQQGVVLRSENGGRSWRKEAITPDRLIQRVWATDSLVYALTDAGIAAGRGSGQRMQVVAPFTRVQKTLTAVAGDRVVLASEEGALYVFRPSERVLRPLSTDSVLGPIHALWFHPRKPDIIIAATERGVVWSGDGGSSFRAGRIREGGAPAVRIGQLAEAGEKSLLAAGANGLYRLRYDINPPNGLERLWQKWKGRIVSLLLSGFVILIGYRVLLWDAARRGNLGRSYGILGWLIRKVPNWVSVKAFFTFYDRFLRKEATIQAASRFFALPARGPGGTLLSTGDDLVLVNAMAESSDSRCPVLLIAGGGAGKSTVLNRIAWLYLQGRLPKPWRSFRPLIVHASEYQTGLVQAVATVLRDRYGIDVDDKSVLALLASKPLLILFDGASEIDADDREGTYAALVAAAASHDFAACRVVIATRPIQTAVTGYTAFELLPLTLERIRNELLPQYRLSEPQRARVLRQLERLGTDGVTPLLLDMAAKAARDGRDSSSEAGLYERYFRKQLRIEGGSADLRWLGWSYMLSTLAGDAVIARGQRGVGFLHEAGVERLEPVIPKLKSSYGIKGISEPAQALNELAEAEILVRNNRRWRFVHDRFEEYFAAVYFIRSIEDHGQWPALDKWTASDERATEFIDILRFVLDLGDPAEIRRCAPGPLPARWHHLLWAPPSGDPVTSDALQPDHGTGG